MARFETGEIGTAFRTRAESDIRARSPQPGDFTPSEKLRAYNDPMIDRPLSPPGSVPRGQEDLRRRILHLASAEIPRIDFLRRLCRLLCDELSNRCLTLWLIDSPQWRRLEQRKNSFQASRLPEIRTPSVSALCRAEGMEAEGWDHGVLTLRRNTDDNGKTITLIPLDSGEWTAGWLGFEAAEPAYLGRREAESLLRVSDTLAIALEQQRLLSALRERVKELTCTHGISRLAESSAPLDEILQNIISLLPPALQFPELASAFLRLDREIYGSEAIAETRRLEVPLLVHNEERGKLGVFYRADIPDPELFLPEEVELLRTVSRQIANLVEKDETRREREKLESQLRHADRLATIGTLAAGVAHELNEPLGAILGFAQLAAGSRDLSPSAVSDLEKIEEAALHAREIVRQLMLFARKDTSRSQPVALSPILRSASMMLSGRLEKSAVRLDLDPGPADACILGDPASLQQIVINLLVNAIQSMPGGGELRLRCRVEGDQVLLEVRDTGIGMSERVLERLFVPFFTTKEINEGTGLGLAVVHGIVSAHGGRIEVESEEGRGSSFTLFFPRIDAPEESER